MQKQSESGFGLNRFLEAFHPDNPHQGWEHYFINCSRCKGDFSPKDSYAEFLKNGGH